MQEKNISKLNIYFSIRSYIVERTRYGKTEADKKRP